MKILAIECDDGKFFISEQETNNYNSNIQNYYFDGSKPEKSFCDNWYVVKSKPRKIEKEISQPDINHRYILIDKSMQNEKIKLELKRDNVAYYDKNKYCWIWKDEYSTYKSLYSLVSDKQSAIRENIDFELELLMKVKDVPVPNNFSYDIQRTQWSHEGLTKITNESVNHQLIDKLIFPKPLLPQRLCMFSSTQTYKIVRQYVKQHINLEIAEITSDYNFCFTVKKKIPLSEPVKYQTDVNWSLFGRKRKPKYVTRYRKERKIDCFEMTHSPENYKGYTPIKGFQGENQLDLQDKIDIYCEELVKFINTPLEDCKYCKGLGVINNKLKERADK